VTISRSGSSFSGGARRGKRPAGARLACLHSTHRRSVPASPTLESSYPCAIRLTRQGASSASRPEASAARGHAGSHRLERDLDALFVAAVVTKNRAVTSEALGNPAAAEDADVVPFVPRQRRHCPSPRIPSFPPKCRSDGSVPLSLISATELSRATGRVIDLDSGYPNLVRQQGSIIRCAFQTKEERWDSSQSTSSSATKRARR
jgi:hypothetical protein